MNVSSCHVVLYARDTYTFGCSWGRVLCQPGRATQYRPASHRGKERKHNNKERSHRTPKIWSATANDQKNNKLVTLGTMPNQNQPSLCTMSFKKNNSLSITTLDTLATILCMEVILVC